MKKKNNFYVTWWLWAVLVLLIIGFASQPEEEVEEVEEVITQQEVEAEDKKVEEEENESEGQTNDETNNETSTEGNVEDIGKDVIAALESNDFIRFTDEYKKLETEKTPVWDNHLYGNKVTWAGTVIRAGSSQLFVYGGNDYNGESWNELADQGKLYTSFVAEYADGTAEEFKKLQTGDQVRVEGDLESRGDFDLGFNWKVYNATIK